MTDKKLETGHDFDGIVELDNDLPGWWLGIFWVTILLALIYVPYYHWLHPEKLPANAYKAAVTDVDQQRVEQRAQTDASVSETELLARYQAEGWRESARSNYDKFCVPCHAPDGGGTIGPNFTDDYYLHGGKISDMIRVITNGVPEKGMVPWHSTFKPGEIEELAFYIKSLRGTTPAVPKESQGKKVDEAGNFLE